jgi:phage terminase large subunit-like protein
VSGDLEFTPDDTIEDPDVRVVSVMWVEDEPEPDVTFTGCSRYEAIGFLVKGLADLIFSDEDEDDDVA